MTSASLPIAVADAAISASGYDFLVGHQGVVFTDPVAIFTDENPAPRLSDFTASIDWGDGTTSVGLIDLAGDGSFLVSGSHVFKTNLDGFPVKVTIVSAGGQTQTVNTTVSVQNGAISANAGDAHADPLRGRPLQHRGRQLHRHQPAGHRREYKATIDGDGTTSPGVVLSNNGKFDVRGSHVYFSGDHLINVTIVDDDLANAQVSTPYGRRRPDLGDRARTPLQAVEGTHFTDTVASFTSANPLAIASDFKAFVSWGDGTLDDGDTKITPSGIPGQFSVSGNHVYIYGNDLPLTVTVVSLNGSSKRAGERQDQRDRRPSEGLAGAQSLVGVGQPDGQFGTLTDSNTFSTTGDFLVHVSWGDGTTSDARLSSTGTAGLYQIFGNHAYAKSGGFNATVTVDAAPGKGSQSASAIVPVIVTPAALSSSFTRFDAQATVPFFGQVATFRSVNASAVPGDFTATIHWGDGTQSDGTISQLGPRPGRHRLAHLRQLGRQAGGRVDRQQRGDPHLVASSTVPVAVHSTPLSGIRVRHRGSSLAWSRRDPRPAAGVLRLGRAGQPLGPDGPAQRLLGPAGDRPGHPQPRRFLVGPVHHAVRRDLHRHGHGDRRLRPADLRPGDLPGLHRRHRRPADHRGAARPEGRQGVHHRAGRPRRPGHSTLTNPANYGLSLGSAAVPIRGVSVSPARLGLSGGDARRGPAGRKEEGSGGPRRTLHALDQRPGHPRPVRQRASEQFFLPTPTATKSGYIAQLITNGNTIAGPRLVTSSGLVNAG